ncbi:FG-GAP repeat domain-containing protein [Paractinoplanes brasiliensis]|nr:VCBS repeat-containing protein [Actinoplanes brasiliensis]GID28073.1 hypothetical protein Abr02nite_30560 [Actinoplanes brasiliensis]
MPRVLLAVVLALTPALAGTGPAQAAPLTSAPIAVADVGTDGRADLQLLGGAGWTNMPVALTQPGETFVHTNTPSSYASFAQLPGVRHVSADFNGDRRADTALLGGAGWPNIPVSYSNGNGTFRVFLAESPDFAGWAQASGVQTVTGDFNRDGRGDIALLGGAGWHTVPVAFAAGEGAFRVTNIDVGDFAGWARAPGVRVIGGDFNADGFADLSLVPGAGTTDWTTLPVAFGNGDGSFRVTNRPRDDFAGWARAPGARVLPGDYDGDHRTDLALVPGPDTPWWFTQPVAFSNGDGTFRVTNTDGVGVFSSEWAQVPGGRAVTGDFNGDQHTDIALLPGQNMSWWSTIPVALSYGDGRFRVVNNSVGVFSSEWAQVPGGQVAVGDFNADRRADIALLPGPDMSWWSTIPVAYSSGEAQFRVVNAPSGGFAHRAQEPGARIAGIPVSF